jgi:prepilin peptidase CpaA
MSQRRIPNWLVLAGMIGGIAFSYFQGLPHVYESLLGLVIGIGVLVVPFALGWMGAGDVKLFGAMGALLGVRLLPRVFFYTALCGLVFALAIIVAKRMKIDIRAFARMATDCWRLFMSRGNVLPATVAERVASGSYGLPYGVAIALGALVARYGDPAGRWAGF